MAKKTRRVKSKTESLLTIGSWQQADKIVREIGDLQLELSRIQKEAKLLLDEAKANLAKRAEPIQKWIELGNKSLEAFATTHRRELGKRQSKKLNFGILGWRKSAKVTTKKNTLELIKQLFSKAKAGICIRVKESVDKDALAKLTDEELVSVGARRKHKEVFFVEPSLPEAVDYE